MKIQEAFKENVINNYGNKGREWLDKLPKIIKECEEKWGIKASISKFDLSYNYVTIAKKNNGEELVLKIGYPHEPEFYTEMEALNIFAGRNIVNLLESDNDLGAMLLEKISPATTLKSKQRKDDGEATRIGAEVISKLPIKAPKEHNLPNLSKWVKAIDRVLLLKDKKIINDEMLNRAKSFFEEIQNSGEEEMLIHGDLHHDNIVYDDKKGWIAIDPKGIIGKPIYNYARLMQNFWETEITPEIVKNRIEI